MKHITISNLGKTLGTTNVLNNVSLDINKGEMVSLLGPSGCGKTTLLRMIAGFESVTSGEIKINDKVVNNIPPQNRNVGIVFQDYAVFPTMTVFNNVAYGLKIKGVEKSAIHGQVMEYLDLVGLAGYENRMPSQLSGGQQQRVALARALVTKPEVLLLDEPLSNLDAALRIKIRKEIRKIQQKLRITAIFVTHDQEEALSISDTIFVMRRGGIMQGGSPASIYESPANDFVASFIGRSNVLYGKVDSWSGGKMNVLVKGRSLVVNAEKGSYQVGQDLWLSIRPQCLRMGESEDLPNHYSGKIRYVEYLGAVTKGEIELFDDLSLDFELHDSDKVFSLCSEGQKIAYRIDPSDIFAGSNIAGLD